MTAYIVIIGIFLTTILLIAGVKAIKILQAKEISLGRYTENTPADKHEDFITIKKDLLVNLILRNEELNNVLEKAMHNYQRSQDEVNFILNADEQNTKDYDNVQNPAFRYENLASN